MNSKTSQHGFTLIEILVVVAIMVILIAATAMTLRGIGAGQSLEEQAQRLRGLFELASDEALFSSSQMGVRLEGRQLTFYRYLPRDGGWTLLENDRSFAPRDIPANFVVELEVEGFDLADQGEDEETDARMPQLVFLSSGEITPFNLFLYDANAEEFWEVKGDLLGQLETVRHER